MVAATYRLMWLSHAFSSGCAQNSSLPSGGAAFNMTKENGRQVTGQHSEWMGSSRGRNNRVDQQLLELQSRTRYGRLDRPVCAPSAASHQATQHTCSVARLAVGCEANAQQRTNKRTWNQ